jgi:FHA domain
MAVCPNGHDSASDDFCDVCGMRIGSNQASPVSPVSPPAPGESCPRCGTIRIGQFCEACGFNFSAPGYTSARASFSPVGSPPRPTFTPITRDPEPEPAPQAPAPQAPAPQAPAPHAPAPHAPAPQAPAPSVAEPSSPSRPSRPSGGGRHSAPRPAYQSSAPGPAAPSYQSSAPGPPAPSYQSSAPAAASSFPYPQATWTAAVGADRGYYEQVQAVTGPEGADVTFPSYYAERRFQLLGTQMRIGRRSVSRGLAPEIDLTGPPADPGISRLHAVLIAGPDGNWAVLDPGSANGTLLNGTEITIGTPVPLHDGDRINLGAWTSVTVHRD